MTATKLVQADINYLAFEGGGGAGNAYPGALIALEQQGIIAYDSNRAAMKPGDSLNLAKVPVGINWQLQGQILGVSGASAGAINALFLSLGYTPTEIEHILLTNDFNKFFDPIIPGLNPCVGGYRYDYTSYDLAGLYEEFSASTAGKLANGLTAGALGAGIEYGEWVANAVGQLWASYIAFHGLITFFPEPALQQLTANLPTGAVTASFLYDFGLFPGLVVRRFFAAYISLAVERILQNDPNASLQPPPGGTYGPPSTSVDASVGQMWHDQQTNTDVRTSEITFGQHQRIFDTKLVVTGSNLETQKSHLFSADTTPNFRVVDAVRISMSLPVAFKPMVIRDDADLKPVINPGESLDGHYLRGVWVDGGLFNNIPIAAFDNIAGGQDRTLGLVVGVDHPEPIANIFGFLSAYPFGLLGGTGGSQLSATTMTHDRVIVLNTYDGATGETMGLLDFTVDPIVYANIKAHSYGTVIGFLARK